MNQPLVSIVMPVYRVEAYVARAIESMLKQSFRDFEYLIVDDGSPDGSAEICARYAAQDARIRLFHEDNTGAFAARNLAIEKAAGKYLYFMDSDDWAEPDMLRDMVSFAEAHTCELVIAGFWIDTYYSRDDFLSQPVKGLSALYEDQAAFRRAATGLFDRNLMYAPWNKLFLRQRVSALGLRFPAMRMDDFPFNLRYIREVGRTGVLSGCYYHFQRARAESETARFFDGMYEKREAEQDWMEELYAFWGLDADAAAQEFLARRYCERALGCIENLTRADCPLNAAERRKRVNTILANPRLKRLLPLVKPHTRMLAIMLRPMRWAHPRLCLLECRLISAVRTHNTRLFARLKANR